MVEDDYMTFELMQIIWEALRAHYEETRRAKREAWFILNPHLAKFN